MNKLQDRIYKIYINGEMIFDDVSFQEGETKKHVIQFLYYKKKINSEEAKKYKMSIYYDSIYIETQRKILK